MSPVIFKRRETKPPEQFWKCPSCGAPAVHAFSDPRTPTHPCPALYGLQVPFFAVNHPDDPVDGRHVLVPREDGTGRLAYVSSEHGDGSNDVNVFLEKAAVMAKGKAPQ